MFAWVLPLLAETRTTVPEHVQREVAQDTIAWGTLGVVVALLVGAALVWGMDRWRKRSARKDEPSGDLTDYRGMYERGEITEDEYIRLRDRLAQRVKNKPATPTAGGASDATAPQLDWEDMEEPEPPPQGPGTPPHPPPPA